MVTVTFEITTLLLWLGLGVAAGFFIGVLSGLFDSREEIARLKEGKFTEVEFQNLCHNMTVDGQPVTTETVCRFKRGCEEYQKKLFGALSEVTQ